MKGPVCLLCRLTRERSVSWLQHARKVCTCEIWNSSTLEHRLVVPASLFLEAMRLQYPRVALFVVVYHHASLFLEAMRLQSPRVDLFIVVYQHGYTKCRDEIKT